MGATPLRTEIRDALLDDLLTGRLSGGERVGVSPLADRFDVSATPAREALAQLEAEGWLELRPNRGFFVLPMTLEEAESTYPVLSSLEGLAVELQAALSIERRRSLGDVNRRLREAAGDPTTTLDLDREWHDVLTRACGNPVLLEHLASVRTRAERYERAYMRYSGSLPSSAEGHAAIVEALADRPENVPAMLREHWNLSLGFLREWLQPD